jgi:hypothetical protein
VGTSGGPGDRIATLALGISGALDGMHAAGDAADGASTASGSRNDSDSGSEGEGEGDDGSAQMTCAMAAMELAEAMGGAGLSELAGLTSGGKEHIMDPRMLNMARLRTAVVPSAGLYASALGLARMAAYLADQQQGGAAAAAGSLPDVDPVALHVAHNTGCRLIRFEAAPAAGSAGSAGQQPAGGPSFSAFGMSALGGTTVLCHPASGTSIAVTVNSLTADRAAPLHIVELACRHLGLGQPADA